MSFSEAYAIEYPVSAVAKLATNMRATVLTAWFPETAVSKPMVSLAASSILPSTLVQISLAVIKEKMMTMKAQNYHARTTRISNKYLRLPRSDQPA